MYHEWERTVGQEGDINGFVQSPLHFNQTAVPRIAGHLGFVE